ncbi:MAG: glutamate-ammonia-ligase adenylyltransferase [Pseudomonadota bacterium]
MKPSYDEFRKACPEADERLLSEHLARLSDRYFKSFSRKALFRHLEGLSSLSPGHPVELKVEERRDGTVDCTVLGFDYPHEFSMITGILAGMGFSILSGDVFTYRRAEAGPSKKAYRKRLEGRPVEQDPLRRRRIIDHFSGSLETSLSLKAWTSETRERMETVAGLHEAGDPESVEEAKRRVGEWVVKRLARFHGDAPPPLYPVQIEIDDRGGSLNRLKVVSEDTPAFLYALSNALALQDIFIEHVRIRTIRGRIEDLIDLVDAEGRAINNPEAIDRIKLSILLTKQFVYFLGKAPDPFAALNRFEQMLKDLLRLPDQVEWLRLLTDPGTMQDLARLLGASDFLWEDFIRLQYETLIPMLSPQVKGRRFSEPRETLGTRLAGALDGASSLDMQRELLNRFKDREIFLIDLDHILAPDLDFHSLSERLTHLAESVVRKAAGLVCEDLVGRFGTPRTVAGLPARVAVLGMGKLGGAALGYASDIELLFVYSDNGRTDGEKSIENAEFFDKLVRETAGLIQAKREGIFYVDLRLRPHGQSGPLACSLENFCRYYGHEGQAHSYERLALVCMRAVGGDSALGAQLERIRDEILYALKPIDLGELRDLRARQFMEKTRGAYSNAKFSPGGLVDLEYGVQILQVLKGGEFPRLRTPRIHEALRALTEAGVFSGQEGPELIRAYDFLRNLINGMRMLRGSARDLFLPPVESDEFAHLARRMGYQRGGSLDPAQQLQIDFEACTAAVRVFIEKHFGPDSLPGAGSGSVVDLILSDHLAGPVYQKILEQAGFKHKERAYVNVKNLAGSGSRRSTFARLAVLAWDILKTGPDPDMALNNWERFIRSLASPEFHFRTLLSQPMRMEIILRVFSTSQFMADTLVRNPGFLDWVIMPEILHGSRRRRDILEELEGAKKGCGSHGEWLNKLRRLRRREILRIGIRDICLGVSTRDIMQELSILAEVMTEAVLGRVWERLGEEGKTGKGKKNPARTFCIMALGKLGGEELNYSSDIDLLGICGADPGSGGPDHPLGHEDKGLCTLAMEQVRSGLSDHSEEGYAYRVDLRLRPFGSGGDLVSAIPGLFHYYQNAASLWEIQAALKMRPVAGNLRLGYAFLEKLRPVLLRRRERRPVAASIEKMRQKALRSASASLAGGVDVKNGLGGIRDVEFLVQGLQLIHASERPGLLEGNTLRAIDRLGETEILPQSVTRQLKSDYLFLRKIEHYLQILEDRQIHALPKDPEDLTALAKRMLGSDTDSGRLMEDLNACFGRVRKTYEAYLLAGEG